MLRNLIERGLSVETLGLFVIDGGKALRAAIAATSAEYALIQRCVVHKRRNVLDHLPERERTFIGRKLDWAWAEPHADRAEAEEQFRWINGYRDLHLLKRALQTHQEVVASTRTVA